MPVRGRSGTGGRGGVSTLSLSVQQQQPVSLSQQFHPPSQSQQQLHSGERVSRFVNKIFNLL